MTPSTKPRAGYPEDHKALSATPEQFDDFRPEHTYRGAPDASQALPLRPTCLHRICISNWADTGSLSCVAHEDAITSSVDETFSVIFLDDQGFGDNQARILERLGFHASALNAIAAIGGKIYLASVLTVWRSRGVSSSRESRVREALELARELALGSGAHSVTVLREGYAWTVKVPGVES